MIGIVDTNHDPSDIDYVIPANDDSSSSVKFFTEIISAKISESKKINNWLSKGKKNTKSKIAKYAGSHHSKEKTVQY